MAKQTGYCVKCKNKVSIQKPKLKTTKNNRKMVQGTCAKCGTKVSRFVTTDFKL
jgi:hypothetical protein